MKKETSRVSNGGSSRLRLLVYREGSFSSFALKGGRWTVGRAEDCDITLEDPTVSRHHLVFERDDDRIRFRDLGGTNATLLDGRRVREGVFAEGSTIVAGETRMTLERLTSASRVRVVSEAAETVILDRTYLEEDEGEGEADPELDAAASVLERLFWPLAETGSPDELALRLLEFAMDQTQRQSGLLGMFDPAGRLTVLASCNREDEGKELRVPEAVVTEARAGSQPFLRSTRHGSTVTERLVVPLGPEPRGLLLLEAPLPASPTNQGCLRLSKALGEIIRCRLAEAGTREQLQEEIQRLRFHRNPAHATILASTRLHPLRRALKEAGRHDLPVLLVGEEGTEKEDLAQYLHAQSSQNLGPFVPFHAAVLPAHRVEEELFGNAKPGTEGRAGGAFLKAGGGTLYIEDPDALPQHVQTRLLQILAEQRREGGVDPALRVRVVASVTEVPGAATAGGTLETLAAALATIQVQIPPLRGHVEDIGSLAELILSEMGPGPDGKPRILTEGAKRRFLDYRWPGNLRQLRMVLEAAAARSGQQPIAERHLPGEVRTPVAETHEAGLASLEEMEKQHIRRVLEAVGGSRAKAARVLGIATSTLYEKMKRFRLRS